MDDIRAGRQFPDRNTGLIGRILPAFKPTRLSPHSLFFIFFNLVYYIPVLAIVWLDFSGPGGSVISAAGLNRKVLHEITYVYLWGICAFLLGSKLSPWITTLAGRTSQQDRMTAFEITGTFRLLCWVVIAAFLLSKALLIPRGVYSHYAFSTGQMTGGLWSASMFLSELLLFLSMVVLFSTDRRNVQWFLLLGAINGINLLHGTRIFFVIGAITFTFYLYVRRKLHLKLLLGLSVFVLISAYAVFLARSHVVLGDGAFSFLRIVSPVMFESLFAQLSLVSVLQQPHLWNTSLFSLNFLLDIFWFTVPRFLVPGKGYLLYIQKFDTLSPLGGCSGYAQGLIYFGIFFPLFYFALGVIADWLLRRARYSPLCSVAYVYFACDFLFRIMRDGYVIPLKMLSDVVIVLIFIVYFVSPQPSFYSVAPSRKIYGTPPSPEMGSDPVS